MRKRFIALFALAAVGLIQLTVTSASGGDGGGQWAIRHETLNIHGDRPLSCAATTR